MGERQQNDPKLITESHHDLLATIIGRYSLSMHYGAGRLSLVQQEAKNYLLQYINININHSKWWYNEVTTRELLSKV